MPSKTLYAALFVGALMVLAYGAAPATAGHLPQVTASCTYEIAGTGDFWENTKEDPTGLTSDGYVSWSGCLFGFDSYDGPDIEDAVPMGDNEHTEATVAVVDDIFASNVGAFLCTDVDNDYVCGDEEKGEFAQDFCGGSSGALPASGDTDGDGHKDFGVAAAVFVNGPINQATICDPTVNPVGGTTGGITNPNGGIFITLAG